MFSVAYCDHFTILLKLVGITVCSAEYAVHRLSLCDVESDMCVCVYENIIQILST